MGRGFTNQEEGVTRCDACGSHLAPVITDLPFKLRETTIVILKDLPVLQCENCTAYLLEDRVMAVVDEILWNVDGTAELEVIKYAA